MAKQILAEKIQMMELFDENGIVTPVTVVRVRQNIVTEIKTSDRDGYEALQIGFGSKKEKNITKPLKGHLKKSGAFPKVIKEFKMPAGDLKIGDKIEAAVFNAGDEVEVRGRVKGRGFQGVVKRHGFKGGPRTHGQKHSEREPGSIGSVWPQRVLKGKRMAGRMGGNMITVKNLKIVKIDPEVGLLYIKGALPGSRGTVIEIKSK
ncbi:50S ribosomal protein L3 [Candidatus Giovannonibacteria bacterium RIFCSPHIGHO2_02_42_15]|uniref:Large ribosomal subunit protein uL3 n=2 Tax=Candidatus Giovannoniibacteriota TaxID=1752738 RepID=A0A1F5VKT1_9BACT|nr:MAG: 50S ribosomal protein L3 [Candidatus Giovannonibacteria bacterium GW2011_GWF2_42_19]OGF63808.1 MAG: 50S ribosomal protein L3 [Candidatus Giovannonibacteria bacterium RIFCSPHIGHO2_02_42_15]